MLREPVPEVSVRGGSKGAEAFPLYVETSDLPWTVVSFYKSVSSSLQEGRPEGWFLSPDDDF